MERTNLAGRAGRWSAGHWKTAFFGWLIFVVVAVFLGNTIGVNKLLDSNAGDGESGRAQKILGSGDFKEPASESVLIQNTQHVARDPEFRAVINDVVAKLRQVPEATAIVSPLDAISKSQGQVSNDQHSALVRFDIKGKAEDAPDHVQGALDAVAGVQKAHPDYIVEEFGEGSANKALDKTLGEDFKRAEKLAVPATLVILLFAFGSLVAAGIPVLLAFSGVLAAIGLSALLSHAIPASDATQSVILLVGMAVGVDYSLFYLKREREERARGQSPHDALLRTAMTSGQAVLISGATVLCAIAGMLVAGDPTFKSISIGTMIVVAVAIIGSLSVLPALMHRLGDNIERGRIPFLHREASEDGSRAWNAVLRPVLRYPWLSALMSAGLLVALTIPAFHLSTKFPSITDLPPSIPIVKTVDRVEKAFPGSPVPMVVVVKGDDLNSTQVQEALWVMREQALKTGKVALPVDLTMNSAGTIARITMPIARPTAAAKRPTTRSPGCGRRSSRRRSARSRASRSRSAARPPATVTSTT